jgi:hypothetical protein
MQSTVATITSIQKNSQKKNIFHTLRETILKKNI